jgi:fumarate reductase subunit C
MKQGKTPGIFLTEYIDLIFEMLMIMLNAIELFRFLLHSLQVLRLGPKAFYDSELILKQCIF